MPTVIDIKPKSRTSDTRIDVTGYNRDMLRTFASSLSSMCQVPVTVEMRNGTFPHATRTDDGTDDARASYKIVIPDTSRFEGAIEPALGVAVHELAHCMHGTPLVLDKWIQKFSDPLERRLAWCAAQSLADPLDESSMMERLNGTTIPLGYSFWTSIVQSFTNDPTKMRDLINRINALAATLDDIVYWLVVYAQYNHTHTGRAVISGAPPCVDDNLALCESSDAASNIAYRLAGDYFAELKAALPHAVKGTIDHGKITRDPAAWPAIITACENVKQIITDYVNKQPQQQTQQQTQPQLQSKGQPTNEPNEPDKQSDGGNEQDNGGPSDSADTSIQAGNPAPDQGSDREGDQGSSPDKPGDDGGMQSKSDNSTRHSEKSDGDGHAGDGPDSSGDSERSQGSVSTRPESGGIGDSDPAAASDDCGASKHADDNADQDGSDENNQTSGPRGGIPSQPGDPDADSGRSDTRSGEQRDEGGGDGSSPNANGADPQADDSSGADRDQSGKSGANSSQLPNRQDSTNHRADPDQAGIPGGSGAGGTNEQPADEQLSVLDPNSFRREQNEMLKAQEGDTDIDPNHAHATPIQTTVSLAQGLKRSLTRFLHPALNAPDWQCKYPATEGRKMGDVARFATDGKCLVKTGRYESERTACVILLDQSGSMRTLIGVAASAAAGLAMAMQGCGASIKAYAFDHRILDTGTGRPMINNLANVDAEGGTQTHLAIQAAQQWLQKQPEPNKLIVVFTDGRPNDPAACASSCLQLKRWNIRLIAAILPGSDASRMRDSIPNAVLFNADKDIAVGFAHACRLALQTRGLHA